MTISHILGTIAKKPVLTTICFIGFLGVGLSLFSPLLPVVFPSARVKRGSFQDAVEMKEIDLLSVQRLQFSNVVSWNDPKAKSRYVKRIVRGHVTTSLDFKTITNSVDEINGSLVLWLPSLIQEAFIDKWEYYDSQETASISNTVELSTEMDKKFREEMLDEASDPNRIARAKDQAEHIVRMLCPDEDILVKWLDERNSTEISETNQTAKALKD